MKKKTQKTRTCEATWEIGDAASLRTRDDNQSTNRNDQQLWNKNR
jgi:hypothetical protein